MDKQQFNKLDIESSSDSYSVSSDDSDEIDLCDATPDEESAKELSISPTKIAKAMKKE